MTWTKQLRNTLPREEIPKFLQDLQALVKALRNKDEDWAERVTDRLKAQPDLVIDYLPEGKKRDRVEAVLRE